MKSYYHHFNMIPEIFGGLANATATTIVGYPLDTLKVKMQSGMYTNYTTCIKDIYVNKGFFGFYKGSLMPWISHGLKRPIQYAIAERAKENEVFGTGTKSNYITGIFQGGMGTILGNPLQVVKIRAQTNKLTTMQNVSHIWNNKGFFGFYRGFLPTLLKDSLFGMGFLGNYYTLRDRYGSQSPRQNFINGAVSHCITWAIFIPVDTIKTNVQRTEGGGVLVVIKEIHGKYGITGFWRGLIPACIRTIPISGCAMLSYEGVRNMLK